MTATLRAPVAALLEACARGVLDLTQAASLARYPGHRSETQDPAAADAVVVPPSRRREHRREPQLPGLQPRLVSGSELGKPQPVTPETVKLSRTRRRTSPLPTLERYDKPPPRRTPEPLIRPPQVAKRLLDLLGTWVAEGPVDVAALVCRRAAGMPPERRLPRLGRRSLRRGGVMLIVDGPGMRGFLQDANWLAGQVRQRGSERVCIAYSPSMPTSSPKATAAFEALLDRHAGPGSVLLVAGDLGIGGTPACWLSMAAIARRRNITIRGIAPALPDMVPDAVRSTMAVMDWEWPRHHGPTCPRTPRPDELGLHSPAARRLAMVVSTAPLVEPALLRLARRQLGEAGVAAEYDIVRSLLVRSADTDGLEFNPWALRILWSDLAEHRDLHCRAMDFGKAMEPHRSRLARIENNLRLNAAGIPIPTLQDDLREVLGSLIGQPERHALAAWAFRAAAALPGSMQKQELVREVRGTAAMRLGVFDPAAASAFRRLGRVPLNGAVAVFRRSDEIVLARVPAGEVGRHVLPAPDGGPVHVTVEGVHHGTRVREGFTLGKVPVVVPALEDMRLSVASRTWRVEGGTLVSVVLGYFPEDHELAERLIADLGYFGIEVRRALDVSTPTGAEAAVKEAEAMVGVAVMSAQTAMRRFRDAPVRIEGNPLLAIDGAVPWHLPVALRQLQGSDITMRFRGTVALAEDIHKRARSAWAMTEANGAKEAFARAMPSPAPAIPRVRSDTHPTRPPVDHLVRELLSERHNGIVTCAARSRHEAKAMLAAVLRHPAVHARYPDGIVDVTGPGSASRLRTRGTAFETGGVSADSVAFTLLSAFGYGKAFDANADLPELFTFLAERLQDARCLIIADETPRKGGADAVVASLMLRDLTRLLVLRSGIDADERRPAARIEILTGAGPVTAMEHLALRLNWDGALVHFLDPKFWENTPTTTSLGQVLVVPCDHDGRAPVETVRYLTSRMPELRARGQIFLVCRNGMAAPPPDWAEAYGATTLSLRTLGFEGVAKRLLEAANR